jgi:hypothetical protein
MDSGGQGVPPRGRRRAGRRAGEPGARADDRVIEVGDLGDLRAVTLQDLAAVLDPDVLKVVTDRLGTGRPARTPQPGDTLDVRRVTADVVASLLPRCLAVAAGLDLVKQRGEEFPPVLWDTGLDRLLIDVNGSKLRLGDGFVDLFLAVECDQTGRTSVACTLVTASMKRPAGFLVATEERPRGPEVVVQVWGEALVALAWRTLVELAHVVASSTGRDQFDRPFVASTVVATPDALLVRPMVPHRFMSVGDKT